MKKLDGLSAIILTALIFADGYVWNIVHGNAAQEYKLQFLNVGQGDSQLITFGSVRILNDAGPGDGAVRELGSVLPPEVNTIDLAIVTHPEKDHFGGLLQVLRRYAVGAILWNGVIRASSSAPEWTALQAAAAAKHIPMLQLSRGDVIHYGESSLNIISPDPALAASDALNDGAIVSYVKTSAFTALLTADIAANVESYLLAVASGTLQADILKVAHHGSKYSSSDEFLKAVNPQIAIIQSEKGNSYGFPSAEALARLSSSTHAAVLRNDTLGTITITGKFDILYK